MGITERKERDRQEMRRLILEAAKSLFLSEGFENVSIRRIAEGIEYSPATVYLYFKDKDEILLALHDEGFRKLLNRFERVKSIPDPIERLHAIGREYVQFAFENKEFYDLMYIERPLGPLVDCPDDFGMLGEVHKIFFDTIEACIKAGHLPKADVYPAAFTFLAAIHGAMALVIRNRCPKLFHTENEVLVNQTLEFLMALLKRD